MCLCVSVCVCVSACVCLRVLVMSAEQVDVLLQRSEGGVDSALSYAKSIAKYLKDVISYVDKRITHGEWISTANIYAFPGGVSTLWVDMYTQYTVTFQNVNRF